MQLTTRRPFRDIDDVFRRYLGNVEARLPTLGADGKTELAWEPSVDVSETKTEYLVKAVLPGVKKEDVRVELNNKQLVISGKRENTSDTENETVHHRESFYGAFSRTFALPDNIDTSKLQAHCENGVLTVHLPKMKAAEKDSAISIPIS